MKSLLEEGIIDGISASFIIDSSINKSTVKSGKKFMQLPRYSVWGFNSNGNGTPKLMENGNDLQMLLNKHNISEDDVYQIDGTMQETIRRVGKNKWAVYPQKGGKRLGTHNTKQDALNQLYAIEYAKSKKENKKTVKKFIDG